MASSPAPAPASNLESLLPRPPTPPRETGKDSDLSVKTILTRASPSDPQDSLQTPPAANTPTSTDVPDSKLMSSRARKTVVWSAHTEYKDPIDYRSIEKLHRSSPLSVPSPTSKPVKGILKPSPSPNPRTLSSGGDFDLVVGQPNIIEMLDSTIKQLAGSDRDSKLDAYMVLSRALKASNNLPDRVALQDKMSLFMQFIQRDITSKNDTGALDSSLINHALTLLATFLHFPAIASTLTSDFGIFIVDHSVRAFEDVSTPKDVVRHLMQVVAFQNFSPKVMTSDRVGRLVTALHQIEGHLKGKSIVMSRIHIYKRLVKQARLHMATHSNWLKDMLSDMLSTVKDIRAQAISLATEAGFALRSEKQLLRKTSEIFQTTNDDQTYIEFYIHRLQEMLKDRASASAVPQIWSAIILFMRCPLERWQYYGPWLTLAQSAFNMADASTKQEANFAWNRYIYLTLADSKTTPKILGTLCQPLLSQLRRKANPRQLEEAVKLQRTVIGGICNLYYYAFAPGNDKFSPDSIWDVAVEPVLSQLISLDGKPEIPGDCLLQAGRILTNLMDVATPRMWRQDRIMETPPANPDELPPLDSKWVRRNCDKVFRMVGPILEKKFIDLANKDSLVFRLWQALVGSVAAASAKDIKVSEETANFFAYAFGLLSKVWQKGIPSGGSVHAPAFLSSVKNFIDILVKALGMLPFTEKKLAMTVGNTFESIATPSHNQSRSSSPGIVRTPLHHLFSMLSSVPLGGADDDELSDFFLCVFEPFFHGKATKARLELVHELLQLLPRESPSPYGPWLLAAQNISLSLDDNESTSNLVGSSKLLGPKYRDVTSLLERGLVGYPQLPSDRWFSLFERLSESVVQQLGDAGRALVVIEPLAKALLDCLENSSTSPPPATSLRAIRTLFDVAKLPRDRTALNTARQRLWGTSITAARPSSLDPFDHLYKLGNKALETFYTKISLFDSKTEIIPLIESVESFLVRCFSQLGVKAFSNVQTSLCLWIEDDKSCYEHDEETPLSKALIHIWIRITTDLAGRGQLTKDEFDQIEPLLTSAFKSKLPTVVDKTIDLWNVLAKDEEQLSCSDSLKSVASDAGSKKQQLMDAEEAKKVGGAFGAQAPPVHPLPDETNLIVLSSGSSCLDVNPAPTKKAATRMSTRKRRIEETPEPSRTKSSKRTSTPRLRHDNSQVQFTTVASSSPIPEDGSQHLTERQKEVRERQRENENIYSDMRTSSPPPPKEDSPKAVEALAPTDNQAGETTPRRGSTSYDNLVTSTPTPRRGQPVHVDDTDPPSSPPVPRPYPLASEIKSRSRMSNSLDSWEFSSPPGSPLPSDQEAVSVVQLPGEKPAGKANNKTATKAKGFGTGSKDVVPSSFIEGESSSSDLTDLSDRDISPSPEPARYPETPTKKRLLRDAAAVEESPRSGDDEFVDARSSPEKPIPLPANDTSFALSEGDESRMMKLADELESGGGVGLQGKPDAADSSDERSSVQSEEPQPPSPPRTRRAAKRATPAKSLGDSEGGGSKRKRKRSGSRQSESRSKKQRPEVVKEVEPVVESENEPASIGMETRGSARRQRQQRQREDKTTGQQKRSSKRNRKRRGGDTDDEVVSQLEKESDAAASQEANRDAEEEVVPSTKDEPLQLPGSMDVDAEVEVDVDADANATVVNEGGSEPPRAEEEKKAKALTIMETLQTSLEQLRQISLPRSEVYKMEDMLMDLKRELFEAERRGRDST
ncbi:Rif1_N domain-containing protein [Trichoderma simmonsii]|uniref:Rif1_N domain-containing protein n=1 Tax=Trichoderma simmonsii TaxID=1491479 RepID=A0A8G0PHE3_9HYPO|nr:Rif1_N domain-containing protein [Trichoderma simmonsii]